MLDSKRAMWSHQKERRMKAMYFDLISHFDLLAMINIFSAKLLTEFPGH